MILFFCVGVVYLWASIPKVVGSIPTVEYFSSSPGVDIPGVENIADCRTIGPRKFFMLAERKKGGKKNGERKKRRERKERKEGKGKKKNRKKERVTAPISSHFVQGQTLGPFGAPKIIYERTLIAECSLICRFYPLCWLFP
jgi:hypothetical protein